MTDWHLFYGQGNQTKESKELIKKLEESPPWREFSQEDNIPANDDRRWDELRELAREKTRQIKKGKNFRCGPDLNKDRFWPLWDRAQLTQSMQQFI